MLSLTKLVEERSIRITEKTESRVGIWTQETEKTIPHKINPDFHRCYATKNGGILFVMDDGRVYLTPYDKRGEANATLVRAGFKFIDNADFSSFRHLSVPDWHLLNEEDKAIFLEKIEEVNAPSAVERDRAMTRYLDCAEHVAFSR